MGSTLDFVAEEIAEKATCSPEIEVSAKDMEFISVIVPVYNEAKHIESVLDELMAQEYPSERIEILVIDGRSTDKTRELVENYARKYPNIHLLDNPKRLASAGRNIGINAAKGNIILIVDGHCIIRNPQMVSNVNRAMQIPGVEGLGRPQPLLLENPSPVQRAIATARESWLGHHPDSLIYSNKPQFVPAQSVGVAYRREIFSKIGLFDETFDACEDCELNHRYDQAGLACYFSPDIGINYVPRDSLSKLAKQMIRYGRGRVRLVKKHPETFSLKMFLPAFFLIGVIFGTGLSFFSSIAATIFACVTLVYGLTVLVESFRLSFRKRFLYGLLLIPLTFVTIHLAAGAGLFWESIRSLSRGKQE